MRRELYPGGPGYPSIIDWELISRLIRFVRANNQCEWCNIRNGQITEGTSGNPYRVILTVAHLDHDKSNSLDPTNLAALCQRCHLTYDSGMKHARRRAGEGHPEMFEFDVAAAVRVIKIKLGLPDPGKGAPLSGNGYWRGGETIDPRGYLLVKQPLHPRADVRGYVYGHVLLAEEMLGRHLRAGERCRRLDPSKPFGPDNIAVSGSHRSNNPMTECDCGCGETFAKFDDYGRQRAYAPNHNGRKAKPRGVAHCVCGCGETIPAPRPGRKGWVLGHQSRKVVPLIACECGCGAMIPERSRYGRLRRFVSGHNGRGKGRPEARRVFTKCERADVYELFEGMCAYGCGNTAASIDHILPVAMGGSDDYTNLVPACRSCNSRKRMSTPWLWIARGMASPLTSDTWAQIIESSTIGHYAAGQGAEWDTAELINEAALTGGTGS